MYRGVPQSRSTDLTPWAEQGVLLLNTTLTVEEGRPGSHARLGWGRLTDEIVTMLSTSREGLDFLLWGGHAREKASRIDGDAHLVLQSAHPSPLSAHRGFFGWTAERQNVIRSFQGKDIALAIFASNLRYRATKVVRSYDPLFLLAVHSRCPHWIPSEASQSRDVSTAFPGRFRNLPLQLEGTEEAP